MGNILYVCVYTRCVAKFIHKFTVAVVSYGVPMHYLLPHIGLEARNRAKLLPRARFMDVSICYSTCAVKHTVLNKNQVQKLFWGFCSDEYLMLPFRCIWNCRCSRRRKISEQLFGLILFWPMIGPWRVGAQNLLYLYLTSNKKDTFNFWAEDRFMTFKDVL